MSASGRDRAAARSRSASADPARPCRSDRRQVHKRPRRDRMALLRHGLQGDGLLSGVNEYLARLTRAPTDL